MLGLPGFRVLVSAECVGELQVQVETTEDFVCGCPEIVEGSLCCFSVESSVS